MQMSHVFLNMQEISQCQCKYHEISLKNLSQLVAAKGFPKFIAILYLVHHNKPWQSITSRSQMWLRQLIHEKEAVGDQRDRFMVNPMLNPWRHAEDHKRHLVSSTAVTVFRLWDLYVFLCFFFHHWLIFDDIWWWVGEDHSKLMAIADSTRIHGWRFFAFFIKNQGPGQVFGTSWLSNYTNGDTTDNCI